MLPRDLENVVSRQEIMELRHRYNWHVVRGEYDRVADLYVTDGLFENNTEIGKSQAIGREAILATLQRLPVGWAFIVTHNQTISVSGDEAFGTCVMTAHAPKAEFPHYTGYYHDLFRRVDGEWYFLARRYFRYYPAFVRSEIDINEPAPLVLD